MKTITKYLVNEGKDPIQSSVDLLISELNQCEDDQDFCDVLTDFIDALESEYEHNYKDGIKIFSLLSQFANDVKENMTSK